MTDDNICYCGNYGGGKHTRSARCPGGEALSSNQCDVCGAPATQWVGDPWGKSNVTRPKCAEHGVRLRDPAGIAEIERLRAALADVAKRLKTGYEPGCDCGGCRTMRYAEKALIGVAVETSDAQTLTTCYGCDCDRSASRVEKCMRERGLLPVEASEATPTCKNCGWYLIGEIYERSGTCEKCGSVNGSAQ